MHSCGISVFISIISACTHTAVETDSLTCEPCMTLVQPASFTIDAQLMYTPFCFTWYCIPPLRYSCRTSVFSLVRVVSTGTAQTCLKVRLIHTVAWFCSSCHRHMHYNMHFPSVPELSFDSTKSSRYHPLPYDKQCLPR